MPHFHVSVLIRSTKAFYTRWNTRTLKAFSCCAYLHQTIFKRDVVKGEDHLKCFKWQMNQSALFSAKPKLTATEGSSLSQCSLQYVAHLLQECKNAEIVEPMVINRVITILKEGNCEKSASDGQDIASVIYYFAFLKKGASCKYISEKLEEFQDISLDLIKKLSKENKLGECSNHELANIIYGLGVLFKTEKQRGINNKELVFCLTVLTREICQFHRLHEYSQPSLANFIFGFGHVQWKHLYALDKLSRQIINRAHGFSGRDLSCILLSVGKLGYHNEELIITLGIEAAGAHKSPTLSDQALCNALHGIALSTTEHPSLRKKIQPVIEGLYYEIGNANRLSNYCLDDVSFPLYTMSLLFQGRYLDQKPWICHLANSLIDRSLLLFSTSEQPLSDFHVTSILHSLTRMNYAHGAYLDFVLEAIAGQKLNLDEVRTVSLLLWCLSSLKLLTKRTFLILCNQITTLREKGAKLTDRNWVQLTQAAQYIKRHNEIVELSPKLKDLLEEAVNTEKTTTQSFSSSLSTKSRLIL